ncbi:hypothetical protein ACF09G_36300 [Streptomyces albogriseolus]|uniref:hypothetical protein n=1 Tax=Streptomyces albogriseolus TaxID=1887 RepID=UPI0019881D36|nr:hypothetical protein [Streptomyces sp.]
MPLFSEDEINAARRREAERNASLRVTTAAELRNWLAGQAEVSHASIHPDAPGTVALELAEGGSLSITVSTDDGPLAPADPEAVAHQELAERISRWLSGETGIAQAWTIPSTTTVGVELVDGDEFTVIIGSRL